MEEITFNISEEDRIELEELGKKCVELGGKFQIKSTDGNNCCLLQIIKTDFCQYYDHNRTEEAQPEGRSKGLYAVCNLCG